MDPEFLGYITLTRTISSDYTKAKAAVNERSPRSLHLNVIQRSRIVPIRRAFDANHVAGLQSDTAHNMAD